MRHISVLAGAAVAALILSSPAAAQQMQGDLHGNYARATQTDVNSWGAGGQLQATWGGQSAPVKLGTSGALDYTKQDNGGPSQTTVSADATLQPGGNGSLIPYAGGSIGANWSGGDQKQWTGAKMGLETLAGLQIKSAAMGPVSWKVEERFGYVKGQEHQLTTRLGAILSF
jgi:hypothetical protein